MRHVYIDGRNWRYWWDDWNLEVDWRLRGLGFCYTQSSDSESGYSAHLALFVAAIYVSLARAAPIERRVQAAIDGQYLWLQWYRGDDEMNSDPFMFEWPWKRWKHIGVDYGRPNIYPYRYELNSGKIQEVQATIRDERREWRWMHRRCPIRKVWRGIDVSFSDEVGEETGTWKGGTLGCAYEYKGRETPLQCLRRMERERAF